MDALIDALQAFKSRAVMMDVGREIGEAFARANAEDVEEALRIRYRAALEISSTIQSGTKDADLTPEQATALDEYEAAAEALAELRGEA